MKTNGFATASLALALACSMTACGAPEQGNPASQATDPANETTLTISPSGISPDAVTVVSGQALVFSNHDTEAHQMLTLVEGTDAGCPSLQIGNVEPGAHVRVTIHNAAMNCTIVDQSRRFDPRFQVKLTVVTTNH